MSPPKYEDAGETAIVVLAFLVAKEGGQMLIPSQEITDFGQVIEDNPDADLLFSIGDDGLRITWGVIAEE